MSSNRIHVKVKPNAPQTKILEHNPATNAYLIALKAPPQEGKANQELIKFLSKTLKKKVKIVSGLRSKNKLIELY